MRIRATPVDAAPGDAISRRWVQSARGSGGGGGGTGGAGGSGGGAGVAAAMEAVAVTAMTPYRPLGKTVPKQALPPASSVRRTEAPATGNGRTPRMGEPPEPRRTNTPPSMFQLLAGRRELLDKLPPAARRPYNTS